jgi:hypothetical protein
VAHDHVELAAPGVGAERVELRPSDAAPSSVVGVDGDDIPTAFFKRTT